MLSIFITYAVASHVLFLGTDRIHNACTQSTSEQKNARTLTKGLAIEIGFDTKNPCSATEILLEKGSRYRFSVKGDEDWLDNSIAASAEGFDHEDNKKDLRWAISFRRFWTQDWFVLLGSTDPRDHHAFRIGKGGEFVAKNDGQLYLFVNDRICPFPVFCKSRPWKYYENNVGTAKVTVELVHKH